MTLQSQSGLGDKEQTESWLRPIRDIKSDKKAELLVQMMNPGVRAMQIMETHKHRDVGTLLQQSKTRNSYIQYLKDLECYLKFLMNSN